MDEKDILVTEQVTENVEQTTEQTPKMFTQEEVNEIVGKSKARERAKIIKQYDRKYGELEDVLKTGMGKENIEEITPMLKDFYKGKGIKFAEKPTYSAKDIEVLARAEADEFIRSGYEDVVEETDRLAEIGVDNMTAREKAVFKVLAEHRQNTEKSRELSKLGVSEDVYNSKEFADFASQFNSNTPVKQIYDIYSKYNPQKEYKTTGSMKNHDSHDSGVKEFYTPEEARKFTKKDFDKNPALFKAIENSMLKWKR
jgi:3-methyladenine DNA glycosylase AlkC